MDIKLRKSKIDNTSFENNDNNPREDNMLEDLGQKKGMSAGMRSITTLLLFAITALVAAITGLIALDKPTSEISLVEKGVPQVVYLNDGEAIFGRIKDINAQFLVITNGQSLTDNCMLGNEKDEVVLNKNAISRWKNLSDNDKVDEELSEVVDTAAATGSCTPSSDSESDVDETDDQAQDVPDTDEPNGDSDGSGTDPDTPVSDNE